MLGSENILLAGLEQNPLRQYELRHKYVVVKSKREEKCDEENTSSFENCVDDFVSRAMDCRLPWINDSGYDGYYFTSETFFLNEIYILNPLGPARQCDTIEDAHRLREMDKVIHDETTNHKDIMGLTGCLPNCRTVELTSHLISATSTSIIEPVANDTVEVAFGMSQFSTLEQKEVFTYDFWTFVADVGGYLGLLLGLSILDVYTMSSEWVTKAAARRTTKQQRAN